jgi:hypothetical protein
MSFQNATLHPGVCDPVEYHNHHDQRGKADFPMSPSALKEFGRCPARWVAGYVSPESCALEWGSLLDCLVLTPELFESRYAVHPEQYVAKVMECPSCRGQAQSRRCTACKVDRVGIEVAREWDGKAAHCKAWKLANVDKIQIAEAKLLEAEAAKAALMSDGIIASFIEASDKQRKVTAEWHDEATGLVVPVRCLIDLLPRSDTEFAKCAGDLKTSFTAAVQPFNRNVHKFAYHVQAALDLDLLVAATGEDRNTWCLVVQESYAPWQTGKRMLSQDYIELGRVAYQKLLRLYCQCLKSGFWPGYDDTDEAIQGWSLCAPEPWMSSEIMFAPRFENPAEVGDESVESEDDLIP